MSSLISFWIKFSPRFRPAILLDNLLHSDFANFLLPKIGVVNLDENRLRFGLNDDTFHQNELYQNERSAGLHITSLSSCDDATQLILEFLKQFPGASNCTASFLGDVSLAYSIDKKFIQGKISRYGAENFYVPILWCHVSPYHSIGLCSSCPLFFLEHGWAKDKTSGYSTPETAEHNWSSFVTTIQSIVDTMGIQELQEINLNLEGSIVYKEKERLIKQAQRLPKLIVDFS